MERQDVEEGCDAMLEAAKHETVAFLVVGDPLWYSLGNFGTRLSFSKPMLCQCYDAFRSHATCAAKRYQSPRYSQRFSDVGRCNLRTTSNHVTLTYKSHHRKLNLRRCTQLYSFGETVSIPFFSDNWQPDSFYDKIKKNKQHGLHTLCLLGAFAS